MVIENFSSRDLSRGTKLTWGSLDSPSFCGPFSSSQISLSLSILKFWWTRRCNFLVSISMMNFHKVCLHFMIAIDLPSTPAPYITILRSGTPFSSIVLELELPLYPPLISNLDNLSRKLKSIYLQWPGLTFLPYLNGSRIILPLQRIRLDALCLKVASE